MSRPRVIPTLFGGAGLGNVRVRSLRAAASMGLRPAAGRGHRKTGTRKRSIGAIVLRSSSRPRFFRRRPKRA